MMLPNQINNQRFSTVGKGGYRASEVDAFIQRVFQNYSKLYSENNILKERLSAITPLIDEYNENKRAIADALIWAKTTSDKTVDEAKQEADLIINEANAAGEKIIAEKTSEAQAVYAQELNSTKAELENAKTELEMTRSQAKSFSERYVAEINAKAMSIIEDANANASKIVADAYEDAKTAREKADAIIAKANEELDAIKEEAAKLRSEIEKAVKIAAEAVSGFSIEEIETQNAPETEIIEAKQIDKNEIKEFTLEADESVIEELSEDIATEEYEALEDEASDDEDVASLMIETVVEDEIEIINEEKASECEDFISGGNTSTSMPDVSAYISKIFDSAGSDESDFSSFADGLSDVFAQSLEESDISFDDLRKAMEINNIDEEGTDE